MVVQFFMVPVCRCDILLPVHRDMPCMLMVIPLLPVHCDTPCSVQSHSYLADDVADDTDDTTILMILTSKGRVRHITL